MNALDRLAAGNPLVGHAPRTHAPASTRRPAARTRTSRLRLWFAQTPDAPRIHLGPQYR